MGGWSALDIERGRLPKDPASMLSRWRCPKTLLPRGKNIYHVGCTDYPDPTYPW